MKEGMRYIMLYAAFVVVGVTILMGINRLLAVGAATRAKQQNKRFVANVEQGTPEVVAGDTTFYPLMDRQGALYCAEAWPQEVLDYAEKVTGMRYTIRKQ